MAPQPRRDAWLGLLGLGLRGGLAVPGVEITRAWLQQDKCFAVIVASDASARAEEKVVRLARARSIPVIAGPDAATLGARLGRPPVMVVGVRDRSLAAGVIAAANRQTD